MSDYWYFAECQGNITRQRRHTTASAKPICRVLWPWHSTKKQALPSALGKGTDKGAHWRSLCRVLVRWTLSREGVFAECHSIRSVKKLVKEPTRSFFAKCLYNGHSAKSEPLPWHSAQVPSALHDVVTTTFLCRVPSDTRQRESDKKYSAKKSLSMYSSSSFFCRVSHSAKPSPSVFQICRVLQTLG